MELPFRIEREQTSVDQGLQLTHARGAATAGRRVHRFAEGFRIAPDRSGDSLWRGGFCRFTGLPWRFGPRRTRGAGGSYDDEGKKSDDETRHSVLLFAALSLRERRK